MGSTWGKNGKSVEAHAFALVSLPLSSASVVVFFLFRFLFIQHFLMSLYFITRGAAERCRRQRKSAATPPRLWGGGVLVWVVTFLASILSFWSILGVLVN